MLKHIKRMKTLSVHKIISTVLMTKAYKRAQIQLGCSRRHLFRLIKKFDKNNYYCYEHKNSKRIPINRIPNKIINQIVKLKITKYQYFNIQHFWEKLKENEAIDVSLKTIKRILRVRHITTKNTHRQTRLLYKRELAIKNNIENQKLTPTELNTLILDKTQQHCLIPHEPVFGGVVELDASEFFFIAKEKWHIHVAIDKTTNTILGAYFDYQETLSGYLHIFKQMCLNYGISMKIVVDNRSCFKVLRNNNPENSKLTQFGLLCKELGIELFSTSVSQHKPVVERVQKTLQDRITAEFSLLDIKTIEQANEILAEIINRLNQRFSRTIKHLESTFITFSKHRYPPDLFFSIKTTRTFANGNIISYKNVIYQPYVMKTQKIVNIKPGIKCLVIETLDKNVYLSIGRSFYIANEFKKFKIKEGYKSSVVYPAKLDHPWRWATLEFYHEFNHEMTIKTNDLYEKMNERELFG